MKNRFKYLAALALMTMSVYASTEWGNLFVKGNLSVTGTSTLTGTTTIGGVTALSQTNTVTGITNKTFTAPVLDLGVFDDQSSTPSSPSSGFYKFYFKTDGKAYSLDSSGTETQLGAGSSGTNDQAEYITNGKFEDSSTGWSTYADAASSSPVDGTGGSPNVTFARTTLSGEMLKGVASGKLTKSAANRQGEGFSYDFTVDYENHNSLRPVYLAIDYKTTANYASGDVKIFIYDRDASVLLGVQDGDNLSGALPAATTPKRWVGVFYPTATTSDSYRIVFHITSTNATAYDFIVDSVHAGSQATTPSSIMTDWTSYTMTPRGSGGNPTKASSPSRDFARWRRVGDSMEVYYDYAQTATTGAANGTGVYIFDIPSGYTIDSNKGYTSSAAGQGNYGTATIHVGSASYGCLVLAYDTAGVSLKCQDPAAASGTMFDAGQGSSTGFTNNATTRYSLRFKVPISNWTSGASVSTTEMLQSIAYVQATGDPASASSGNPIIFGTENYDTHNAYSTSTGQFTAPKSGRYRVHGFITSANAAVGLLVYPNGSGGSAVFAGATDSNGEAAFAATIRVSKDETIDLRPNNTLDAQSSSIINIEEVPDFSIFSQYNVADRQYTCTLSGPAGWSTTYCYLLPYLTADGTWRARFNFQGTYTSAASASVTMTGVTFAAGGRQAISCNDNSGGSAPANNYGTASSSTINIDFASNNSDTTCSGDVALASKPTMVP